VVRTFKYRLYPTKAQAKELSRWLTLTREIYNAALQERKEAWEKQRCKVTKYDQQAQLKEVCEVRTDINVPVTAMRGALSRLDKSFRSFFRRCRSGEVPGYPRFKGSRRWDTLEFENKPTKGFICGGGKRILIPCLGKVRVKLHRPLEGSICTLKITLGGDGNWYSLICCNEVPPKLLTPVLREVGVDLGLLNFASTSDGEIFNNPRSTKQSRIVLERAHRRVSRRKKGSNRRYKAVSLLRKKYIGLTNVRREHHIKVAKSLVSNYDVIYVEALNIKGLARGMLAKSVNDAAWGNFLIWLRTKAEEAGREVIEVNPAYTSKTCSKCGHVEELLTLVDRSFECGCCAFVEDRDINAAINIKRLGSSRRRDASAVREHQRPEKYITLGGV
jgi:putative transposase